MKPGHRTPHEPVEVVQGLRAGLALIARRPNDVLRVTYSNAVRRELAEATRRLTAQRIPIHPAADSELDRLAGSSHHEGLCIVARPRQWLSTRDLAQVLTLGRGAAVALDRVRNPYNIGATLRSAAFFALDAVLLGAPSPHPALAATAVRVAEGGAEHVALVRTTNLADTLERLRAQGARVVGADTKASRSVFGFVFSRPTVLVMGNEREGLGDRVRAQCDALVCIPGKGPMESLNVAVAAGVLLGQMSSGFLGR